MAGRGDEDEGENKFAAGAAIVGEFSFLSLELLLPAVLKDHFCMSLPSFNLFLPVCQKHCLPDTIPKTREKDKSAEEEM